MKLILLLAGLTLVPGWMCAQGSGGAGASAGPVAGSRPSVPSQAFEVTKTIKLRLVAVRKDNTIVVKDERGETVTAKLDRRVYVRADKGTELAGQKHLSLENLEPGMLLKATYRASDFVVVELRILKEPRKAAQAG